VIPLSLGIETMGGLVEKIIPRNSTIPCARAQVHHLQGWPDRAGDHVLQGERELVADCRSLARFELRGIPPMAAGAAHPHPIQVDADGLLSVSARELRSGVEASITVKPSYGLGDDDVARMLQDLQAADVDMKARALREEQVEAERILLATESALEKMARCCRRRACSLDALMASVRGVVAQSQPAPSITGREGGGGSAGARHRRICIAPHGSQRAQHWPARSWIRSFKHLQRLQVPQIVFLPHAKLCPDGAVIEAPPAKRCATSCWKMTSTSSTPAKVLRLHHLPRAGARRLRFAERSERERRRPAGQGLGPGSRVAPVVPGRGGRRRLWSSKFRSTPSTTLAKAVTDMKWTDISAIAEALYDKYPDRSADDPHRSA
jgi:hypothetical protein